MDEIHGLVLEAATQDVEVAAVVERTHAAENKYAFTARKLKSWPFLFRDGPGGLQRNVEVYQSAANMRFQSSFMLTTVQPLATASSHALSNVPMCDLRS